ncbi:MAG: alpha/beta hydrolase [Actinomycetia bacterium]|nr:alpha/beta hydrolase [Actinomycetes bacterium]
MSVSQADRVEISQRPSPGIEECWLENRLLAMRRFESDGTPAVMIHGLGGTSLNWTDLAYGFGDRLSTYVIDLPGFGASPPPRDGDYSIPGHAQAVVDFIDEYVQQPVHLFGNSMGGAIALQIAARFPDRVRSNTMVSPALAPGRPNLSNIHMPVIAIPGVGERFIARYYENPVDKRVNDTLQTVFVDPSRYPALRIAEMTQEIERRDRLTYPADAFMQSLRGIIKTYADKGPNRITELAKRVKCPTLLVYGRRDKLVSSKSAHKMGNLIPDSRVVILPDSGHVAQMEHPDEVMDYWFDLIDGIHPRTLTATAE